MIIWERQNNKHGSDRVVHYEMGGCTETFQPEQCAQILSDDRHVDDHST